MTDLFDDKLARWQEWCAVPTTGTSAVWPPRSARVANDYLTDDLLKEDPDYFAALERLELALCGREPFIRLAGLWQLVAEA